MSIKHLSFLWGIRFIGLTVLITVACQATVPLVAPDIATATQPEAVTPTQPDALPTVAQILLDQPFELAVGQQVALAEANLHLRFERVLDDSRCPRQVTCVWSGEARLAVSIWSGDATPKIEEFSTFSRPPDATDTHTFQGFSIKLVTVDPYPDIPGQPIPGSAYRITLRITRSQ